MRTTALRASRQDRTEIMWADNESVFGRNTSGQFGERNDSNHDLSQFERRSKMAVVQVAAQAAIRSLHNARSKDQKKRLAENQLMQ